ncbi:MAG: signal recognition particle-docking protein FtsY, partial [Fibrobacter sp.]|nr:signal recognition particle-docking protein FtsY [Fibrobacter sp.]
MGLFSAIKSGLAKTRDALMGELKGIVGAGKITDDTLEELEEHLIKADVGVEAAFLLTDALREQALGKSLTTEQVLDIMRSEAERLLKDPPPFELKGKPHVVLVIGVNGAGKTTTIGKLAARLKDEGKKVMIAACDTFRAAAIDQLETWAERSGAEFVKHQEGSDPAAVAFDACNAAVARGCDVVLIDTAGRLHNKDYLMEELKKIVRVIKKVSPDMPHD